uniref:Uncharacterized protein n=1 Tax=Nitzschia sp. PL1-4 TaxID=2083272 RepID=A0A2Z5ZAZ3_9STRA|nr:hypothetical protein ycf66 [Nitzschia sp. PL1-4]
MIYINFNILLNFFLILYIFFIYTLQVIRPEIVTDTDVMLMSLLVLYNWVLVIQGWKFDPIMLFSQYILILLILTLEWENIRLRGFILILKKIINNK